MRSMLLATVLAVLVVFCWGESLITTHWIAPVRLRERQAELLRESVAIEEATYERICEAERRLKELCSKSLPADVSVAATLYQNWLVDRVNEAGWRDGIVTPNRIAPDGNDYSRLPFTVTAKCNLDELCDFLYEFRRTPMLHKIKEINIDSRRYDNDPELSVEVQVEAIAIATTDDKRTLPNLPKMNRLAHGDRQSYSLITTRNPFTSSLKKTLTTNKSQVVPASPKPLVNFSENVFHIGTIIKEDSREAWLFDRSKKTHYVLEEGESFDIHGVKGEVTKIAQRAIGLNVNGEQMQLDLAENLGQFSAR